MADVANRGATDSRAQDKPQLDTARILEADYSYNVERWPRHAAPKGTVGLGGVSAASRSHCQDFGDQKGLAHALAEEYVPGLARISAPVECRWLDDARRHPTPYV